MIGSAAATLSPTAYWYLTRGTGVVALLLLTAIMALGILGPLRIAFSPRWPRFALDAVHRDLSLLAVLVIAIHVLVSVLDGFAPIKLIDGVLPFASPYRPIWLGLGAVSFDLMLAVILTSMIRRRIGYASWRFIHWLAYASWPLAVVHGLGTGSDAGQAWALAVTFACVVVVAAATLTRVTRAPTLTDGARATALAAVVAVPVALGVFTLAGPLSPDWARRAGTPADLLGHSSTVAAARAR